MLKTLAISVAADRRRIKQPSVASLGASPIEIAAALATFVFQPTEASR